MLASARLEKTREVPFIVPKLPICVEEAKAALIRVVSYKLPHSGMGGGLAALNASDFIAKVAAPREGLHQPCLFSYSKTYRS